FNLESGKTYRVTFMAKAESNRSILALFQRDSDPYTHYWQQSVDITTAAANYGPYTWTSNVSDGNTRMNFKIGGSNADVWIDNVRVESEGIAATPTLTPTNTPTPTIIATPTPSASTPPSGTVDIDRDTKYQTIEGFGFFGAMDCWWNSSDPYYFYNDAWLTKIIDDLGLTIWRNELYPHIPPDQNTCPYPQDAWWGKQSPLAQALKQKADAYNVPLKYVLTVWTPPSAYKWWCSFTWAGDTAAQRGPGGADTLPPYCWPTFNGGTLNPEKYADYANWLKAGLQMYENAGIDVYALSLQNEPLFTEPYNSCTYTTFWYVDLLNNVVPSVKAGFPGVKIFGSENMLGLEGAAENYQWFYHMAIKNNPQALSNLDRWAVHGYTDGVSATDISVLEDYWTRTRTQFSDPSGKPYWQTEISGYGDNWEKTDVYGAFELGLSIASALQYGRISAWVWWQGSELAGISQYSMMQGTNVSKKYYVSKQFYRFIRPGARMVALSSGDPDILACAFEHGTLNNFVVVLLNKSTSAKTISLGGANIPDTFTVYRTTGGADNCSNVGTTNKSSVYLPAKSVVTLVNGSYKE
ncbi:MAG: glycoside hydrolase family 30 beta sandwich domain-containing protein, partial [Bacillota bacterium]